MKRKLIAAWRLVWCKGYILCTIDNDPSQPFYDHNVTESTVVRYNRYILDLYDNQDVLIEVQKILDGEDH